MDMEFINGGMVKVIKGIGKIVKWKGKVNLYGQMDDFMKEIF